MKKIFSIAMLLFGFCGLSAGASYFWDAPHYLVRHAKGLIKSDVKIVKMPDGFLIFFIARGKRTSALEFYSTADFQEFKGPFKAVEKIKIEAGFFHYYDVLYSGSTLFLVWNTLDGALHSSESRDGGRTWDPEKEVLKAGRVIFNPRFFYANGEISLFYHTESEGRRIDSFYVTSIDSGKSWEGPYQITKGFAGSFFPYISFLNGSYTIVWQSRPLSENEAPVFDIYFSKTSDLKAPWSIPVNLTNNPTGEDVSPRLIGQDEHFSLIWESDRDGAWGIYYREYDGAGNPLSEAVKVNTSLANARDAQVLQAGKDFYIFYIDERDGKDKLYYVKKTVKETDSGFEESGPLGSEELNIMEYFPFRNGQDLYVFWHDERGIAFTGPDHSVLPVKVFPLRSNYIGKKGISVRWERPKDPSGIEGYGYLFSRNEIDEPEIINLSPGMNDLRLAADEEGEYFFHIRALDAAGNYSKTVTVPFIVDLTPPPVPKLTPLKFDENGFYKDNSPSITWSEQGTDIAGYNYSLTRKQVTLKNPRIRIKKNRIKYRSLASGTWFFNLAAVDKAGNLSETSHVMLRLKLIPQVKKKEKEIKIAPPWTVLGHSFRVKPFLNISLYIILCGLLIITFYITADVLRKYRAAKEGALMEQEEIFTVRTRRLGLRFKFSIMIGVLVMLLTVGISLVLSIVTIEHEKRALANQMMDKARLSLENMTNVAREGILNNDELLLLSVITKTMENSDIKYSIILDPHGRVIAHSDIQERGKVSADEFTHRALQSQDILIDPDFSSDSLASLYELASPVTFAGRRIGTVRLGYSTRSIFATISEARKTSIYNTIIITLITIIVGIAGAIIMASITIKPIKVLAHGANIIGSGKLEYKIHVRARDEIGLLADEFNRMTARLLIYQREMKEKAKLDEQLDIARNIQQDLIPHRGIDNEKLCIDGFYKAAAAVGGDYYDFIEIGNGRYSIIMSDVAGKGVPASLMMIMIRTVFKALIHSGIGEPSVVVTLMNSTLAPDIASDRFATLLFGVFNLNNRLFRYTNAGYGPLMVYKKDQNSCFLVNPQKSSVPVGVMPDIDYNEEDPIQLNPGDALFLFTDGIHEARNEQEQEYGMKRMAEIIPNFAEHGAKEIANLIIDDVLEFAGSAEQYDDMTLLVMKVK